MTDIVFLRKRAPGEPANHVDPEWLGIAPLEIDGAEVPVNRYFLNHPEMVLGTWSRKDTLYGEKGTASSAMATWPSNSRKPSTGFPNSHPLQAIAGRGQTCPGLHAAAARAAHRRRQLLRRRRPRHLPVPGRARRARRLRRHDALRPTAR